MNPVVKITSQKQLLEAFGQPIGNEMFTPEMIAESLAKAQQVDLVASISLKPGELGTITAKAGAGKTRLTPGVFAREIDVSQLDQTDWFDWSDPPDGLTGEETGPV